MTRSHPAAGRPGRRPAVVVVGAGGRLGGPLVAVLARRGWEVVAPARAELDVTVAAEVNAGLAAARPEVVVNLAAWTDLARCEADEAGARVVNATAVGHLRDACEALGAHLVHLSTDFVFDGEKGAPYVEDDPVGPLSAYARTKQAGEEAAGTGATVVRTAWLAGTVGSSLVTAVLDQAAVPGRRLRFVADQWGSPTSAPDLARLVADVAGARPGGTLHAVNAGAPATRHDVAAHVLAVAGHDPDRVEPVAAASRPDDGVRRPRATALADARLAALGIEPLRPWREAFADLVADLGVRTARAGGRGPARR